MTIKCSKCHGIIPDLTYGDESRTNCKNHIKTTIEFDFEEYKKNRTDEL